MNREIIERTMRRLGHAWFEADAKPFNLNIVGVRSANHQANAFDDWLTLSWKYNRRWYFEQWRITTDPGSYYLRRLLNPAGCAILVPGQYRGAYALDLHNGKYRALCQRLGPVRVYRDANKDDVLDLDPKTVNVGMFGINIHRAQAAGVTAWVNSHSAGCQVVQNSADFSRFRSQCEQAAHFFGNRFTYTLLRAEDLS